VNKDEDTKEKEDAKEDATTGKSGGAKERRATGTNL
jgi:hypothetical protein